MPERMRSARTTSAGFWYASRAGSSKTDTHCCTSANDLCDVASYEAAWARAAPSAINPTNNAVHRFAVMLQGSRAGSFSPCRGDHPRPLVPPRSRGVSMRARHGLALVAAALLTARLAAAQIVAVPTFTVGTPTFRSLIQDTDVAVGTDGTMLLIWGEYNNRIETDHNAHR